MNYEQLNTIAQLECDNYTTPCDGELVWCNHPDNKCQTEGNCHPDDCPRLAEMTSKAIDDLFGNGSQFN